MYPKSILRQSTYIPVKSGNHADVISSPRQYKLHGPTSEDSLLMRIEQNEKENYWWLLSWWWCPFN